MYTQSYPSRRTYSKYDDARYLLYLNEEAVDYAPPGARLGEDAPAPVPGFSYTGSSPCGGTLIASREASYGAFVAGLIGLRYSDDDVQAIQTNMLFALKNAKHEKAAQYKAEFDEYNDYRATCKQQAKAALGAE